MLRVGLDAILLLFFNYVRNQVVTSAKLIQIIICEVERNALSTVRFAVQGVKEFVFTL